MSRGKIAEEKPFDKCQINDTQSALSTASSPDVNNPDIHQQTIIMEIRMGRGILLWLLGVPIPVIIILALIWH